MTRISPFETDSKIVTTILINLICKVGYENKLWTKKQKIACNPSKLASGQNENCTVWITIADKDLLFMRITVLHIEQHRKSLLSMGYSHVPPFFTAASGAVKHHRKIFKCSFESFFCLWKLFAYSATFMSDIFIIIIIFHLYICKPPWMSHCIQNGLFLYRYR